MSRWSRVLAILLLCGIVAPVCGIAHGQNQRPATPLVLDGNTLPDKLRLRLLGPVADLPTLQSFAAGTYAGLWVMVGDRLNGLHTFTDDPLKNFPRRVVGAGRHRVAARVWIATP
jgi:hypothetical protein